MLPSPSLLIFAPRVPPVMCGIGDFTFHLAKKLRHEMPGLAIRFAVSDPSNPATSELDGFPKTVVNVRDEAALFSHFEEHARDGAILLQFAQYDFDDRARPSALISALVRWRNGATGRKLGIFVHELWLPALVRRREWLDYPFQWLLTRRLFRAADLVFVSNRRSVQLVSKLRGRAPDALLPIFSTIGEPPLNAGSLGERAEGGWIFFGSAGRTLRSLRRFARAIEEAELPRSVVDHITVMGGKHSGEIVTLLASLRFPHNYRPDRPATEISAALHQTSWSFLDYDDGMATEPTLIFKSSVLAALLSHGVVPVLPEAFGALEAGGEKLQGLLTLADFRSGPPSAHQRHSCAQSNFDWYGRHVSVSRHVAALSSFFSQQP